MANELIESEKIQKNLDNVQALIKELMQFYVTLDRKNIVQQGIIRNLIEAIKSKTVSFNQIMKQLMTMMKNSKAPATKAVLAQVFNIFLTHYKEQEELTNSDKHGQIERTPATKNAKTTEDDAEE